MNSASPSANSSFQRWSADLLHRDADNNSGQEVHVGWEVKDNLKVIINGVVKRGPQRM